MEQERSRLMAIILRLLSAVAAVSRQRVFRFDLESDTLPVPSDALEMDISDISTDALPDLSRWPGARSVRKFRKFLNQRQVGHYLIQDGETVYYHWCKIKRKPHALSCAQDPIEPGTAYLHRGLARKEFRKTGLGTLMMHRTVGIFRKHPEVTRLEVAIEPVNIPSQKLFLKCGFTLDRQFTLIVILVLIHIHIVRDIRPDGSPGPARYRFSLKAPTLLWSPALFTIGAWRKLMNRLA